MPFVAWAVFCLAFLCMAPLCMGGLLRDGVFVVPYFRTAISCMVRPAHEAYLSCDAAWWGCPAWSCSNRGGWGELSLGVLGACRLSISTQDALDAG